MQGSLLSFRAGILLSPDVASLRLHELSTQWGGMGLMSLILYVWIVWANHCMGTPSTCKINEYFRWFFQWTGHMDHMSCGVTATARLKRLGSFEPNYLATARGPKKSVGNSSCRFITHPLIDGWCRVGNVDGINDRGKKDLSWLRKMGKGTWS